MEKINIAVAVAPESGVDTLTGEGLAEVVRGATAVVDVSDSPSFEDEDAVQSFTASTRDLLAHEAAAGVPHHMALSPVGTERLLESRSFRARLAREQLIKASAIPYSIVRATPYFESLGTIADVATHGAA